MRAGYSGGVNAHGPDPRCTEEVRKGAYVGRLLGDALGWIRLSRPARPGVRRMRVPLAAYAALAAGIVLGVAFVAHEARVNRAPEFTLTHSLTHSLTQWTSPTASLLHTPGAELLYAPPPIATSTLDRFISQPATHPGTPQ